MTAYEARERANAVKTDKMRAIINMIARASAEGMYSVTIPADELSVEQQRHLSYVLKYEVTALHNQDKITGFTVRW